MSIRTASESDKMIKPESEEKVARMFDLIAPRYDLLNKLLSAKQDVRWRKVLISNLPKVKNNRGRLLDVATGTGDVLLNAAEHRRDYALFTGVDISANMLKLARDKSQKLDSKIKVKFRQMSAENLLFEDESFEAITISFGLRNVVRKERALSEMLRLLKPKGRLLILEFFSPQNTILAKMFMFYFRHILPKIGGMLSDKNAYKYLPMSVESFHTSSELQAALTRVGFSQTREISFLFGACRLILADK